MNNKLAFDQQDRGYRIRVWYRDKSADALAEITFNKKLLRHFLYPAYKIWNLSAHFGDIVDSEIEKNVTGYLIAGSDGLGGCVYPQPTGQQRGNQG